MAVHMTRSNEIQSSSAARLLDMLLPRPSSTFLLRSADAPGSILVVDRAVPPTEGRKAVLSTEKGLRLATLGTRFDSSRVWGVVTWVIRDPA